MFLLFRKEFHEPIRSGRKRQTVRFWEQRPVKPGGRMHSPHLGKFLISYLLTKKKLGGRPG